MHVEPLEKLPHSVREFLSHYAMIVLSILTALALEQVVLRIEHHHQGERAKEEIEQEIASNREAVEHSLTLTQDNARAWQAMLSRTVAEIKAGQSTEASRLATLHEASREFRDALPPLKTTAWDSALSDHGVNYLSHEDLTRYSELYAAQRLFAQAMWDMLRDSATHTLSDLSLAIALDKADPTTTVSVLNSRVRTVQIIESHLTQLDEVLKSSTEGGHAAAPASATSAASAR